LEGKDELTALGREINAMLARLSTVNEQLLESEIGKGSTFKFTLPLDGR
jgi:hypothetical protein